MTTVKKAFSQKENAFFILHMRRIFFFFAFIYVLNGWGQIESSIDTIDYKYKEDQFYININYTFFSNASSDLSQNISYEFNLGHIKDIPINKKRNIGFGIGIGYSNSTDFFNLNIVENEGGLQYEYNKQGVNASMTNNSIVIPIEFRWRTSTFTSYSFWRIYSGVKFQYLLSSNHHLNKYKTNLLPHTNRFTSVFYLNAGHNSYNISFNYDLNSLFINDFKNVDGKSINSQRISLGLIFYIL